MGDNTLATIQQGTVGNPEQVNQYKEALSGDILPRNVQGEVEDSASSIGSETARVKDVHMAGFIFNEGTQGGFCPSGVMLPYTASATIAPSGWIFADGKTIGADGSGADYEGEIYRYLFNLYRLITNYGNAGTEDFDSSDTVIIPNPNGRFVRSIGSQNPDSSTIGEVQASQNKAHTHTSPGVSAGGLPPHESFLGDRQTSAVVSSSSGGPEARPRAISFPYIIKV